MPEVKGLHWPWVAGQLYPLVCCLLQSFSHSLTCRKACRHLRMPVCASIEPCYYEDLPFLSLPRGISCALYFRLEEMKCVPVLYVTTLSFLTSCLPLPPLLQSVTDGDLCEQFNSLEPAKKRGIADSLDRTPNEARQPLTPTWKAATFHCAHC